MPQPIEVGWLSIVCLIAAGVPVLIACRNFFLYRPLAPCLVPKSSRVSVLIPARNEQSRILGALQSLMKCHSVELEILVWDDASTDSTPDIVKMVAASDPRVRLLGDGSEPPRGWAGKQYACSRLAQMATGDVLVFMDADVRLLTCDALVRLMSAFDRDELDFLSGVPLQETKTWSERMIVPLIHFVLMGFLPMDGMRRSKRTGFAAGCGQLIACRAGVYHALGGHALVAGSFHEGLGLARAFRRAGRVTDLVDLSCIAVCRMYEGSVEVWNGFAKNAHEGLAAPASVIPMSMLLFFGQVAPAFAWSSGSGAPWARKGLLAAWMLGVGLRAAVAIRFKQSWLGVLLHPLSVAMLLLNQWYGALRHFLHAPVGWRGRTVVKALLLMALWTVMTLGYSASADAPKQRCPDMELEDQHGHLLKVRFPRKRPCLLVIAGRKGTGSITGWVKPVQAAFGDSVDIMGLADVHTVPVAIRPAVRAMIRRESGWPILMDWSGKTVSAIFTPGLDTEVLILKSSGEVELRLEGSVTADREVRLLECLRGCGAIPLK